MTIAGVVSTVVPSAAATSENESAAATNAARAAHPCMQCGACCAHFRVAFHWSETDARTGGVVPLELTETLDLHRLAMRGTYAAKPHCIALEGVVGVAARCSIYEHRPSVCREVAPSWETGAASAHCDKARLAYGLPLLTPGDWPLQRA